MFDQERYEWCVGSGDPEYFLESLEIGFHKAADSKLIPLETLLKLICEFRNNGYKNEWLHKRKIFREFDLDVKLNCYFTMHEFRLEVTIARLTSNENLCSEVILQTRPDEVFFDKKFKDILIDERNITVTDFLDKPRFLIDLKKAMGKKFEFEQIPDEEEDDD